MAAYNPYFNEDTGWADASQMQPWQQALMNPSGGQGFSTAGVNPNDPFYQFTQFGGTQPGALPNGYNPYAASNGIAGMPNFSGPNVTGSNQGGGTGTNSGPMIDPATVFNNATTPSPATIASPALMANSMGMTGAQSVGGTGMYTGANAPLDMSRFAPNGIDQAMMSGSMGGFGEALFKAAQQNGMNPGTSYLGFMDDLSRRTLQAKGGQGGLLPQDFVNYLQSQGGQQWVNSQRAQPQTPQTPQGPQIQQTGPPTQPSAPRPPGYNQPQQNTQGQGQPRMGVDPYTGIYYANRDPSSSSWGQGLGGPNTYDDYLRQQSGSGFAVMPASREQWEQNQIEGQHLMQMSPEQRMAEMQRRQQMDPRTQSPVIGSPGMMGRPTGLQMTPEQAQFYGIGGGNGQMQVDPASNYNWLDYYSPESQARAREASNKQQAQISQLLQLGWPPEMLRQMGSQQLSQLGNQPIPYSGQTLPDTSSGPGYQNTFSTQGQQQPTWRHQAAQFSSDPATQRAYMQDMYGGGQQGGWNAQPESFQMPDFRAATFGGSLFPDTAKTPGAATTGSGGTNTPANYNPMQGGQLLGGGNNSWGNTTNRRSGFGGMSLFGNGMGGGNTGGGQTYGQPASQYRGAGSYGRPASYGQSQRPY